MGTADQVPVIVADTPQERSGVYFASIDIDAPYWSELSESSMRAPDYFRQAVDRGVQRYFRMDSGVDDADPIFDITILNKTSALAVLTHLGVEIVCLKHEWAGLGGGSVPKAEKIIRSDMLELRIPDKWRAAALDLDPDEFEWLDANETVFLRLPDPVALPAGAPYRCGLRLSAYQNSLPNVVILRICARTGSGEIFSERMMIYAKVVMGGFSWPW
jgi:hypothetical protein